MDSSLLWTVAICLLVTYVVKWLLSRRNLPPGPISLPFVGYLPFLSRKPFLDFQKLGKKYGDIFGLQMGNVYVVILNDYHTTKEAFAQDALMGRPDESPFELNKETIETGAFNRLPWKEQRRFSLHMLRDLGFGKSKMEGHIQEEINEMLEMLEKQDGQPYCIYHLLAPSMSNNISSLVFGKRLEYDHPERQMMTKSIQESASAAGQVAWQLFFPKVKKIFQFLGIGDVNRISRILSNFKDYTRKQIEEHEKTLDPNNIRDYIDGYLLEIQRKRDDPAFNKVVLEDLVGAFFGAGSETVRLTVEWLTLTAAQYQDTQRRVQREIDDVIGRNTFPNWQDHKSMPYTQAFIMELIRWRTIVPINLIRSALTDTEVAGYHIPKDTQVIANLWAIHHNKDYWGQDANEFNPERFLTEDGKEVRKRDHYIPFSIGKRACPGEPLARIEVFLYIVSILQKFDIRIPEGKVIDFEGDLGVGLMPRMQELIFTKRK